MIYINTTEAFMVHKQIQDTMVITGDDSLSYVN